MIEIETVSHRIHGHTVLDRVQFSIPKGGITALIGPNGAGKSTLLSLMARLDPLQSGAIRFDGLDVRQTPTADLARKLSILRQDTTLGTRLTVQDLVTFGRFPHHRGRPGAEDHAKIEAALETMALLPLRGRFLDALSGGQRQRALVAMVLAQDTDYVLLDEPLNNLDMKHARQMMQRLRRSAIESAKTFVIVIHDINFAAAYADRIVALRDGRLHAIGTPREIVTRDMLREIFDLDILVQPVNGHPFALHQLEPPDPIQEL